MNPDDEAEAVPGVEEGIEEQIPEESDETPLGRGSSESLPGIRMLHDRVLLDPAPEGGERRSRGGILIPATAKVGTRLGWARVVAVGRSVKQVDVGDAVLFDPSDPATVEIDGRDYVLVRERELHAVATRQRPEDEPGQYL